MVIASTPKQTMRSEILTWPCSTKRCLSSKEPELFFSFSFLHYHFLKTKLWNFQLQFNFPFLRKFVCSFPLLLAISSQKHTASFFKKCAIKRIHGGGNGMAWYINLYKGLGNGICSNLGDNSLAINWLTTPEEQIAICCTAKTFTMFVLLLSSK